jgi:hypothetical protein
MGSEPMAVVLFPNTQTAVRAEQLCRAEGIQAKLIPTPRHLSSTCGLAVRIPGTEGERVRRLLEGARIPHGEICEL